MTALDATIFRRKGEQLRLYVKYLEEYRGMPLDEYVADHHIFGLAEHYLEHAVETTLDIGRSVAAGLGLPQPDEAHGLFILLTEAGVLPAAFAKEHVAMVGLRNRLVHEYASVDHEKTHQYIQEHLDVFEEFLNHIQAHIDQ